MQKNQQESRDSVTKLALQFLAEVIGQCPAELEKSTERDVVFAVVGFQYGAVQSAAYAAGLEKEDAQAISEEVIGRINGMEMEAVQKLLELMPMLARKEYPPIGIGQRAIISFYNAASDEDKLTATETLREILHQIDRS
ncbi:hypothetical protein EKD00_02405 [Chlorobium phaeovibrioides]|uniref:hypothetical protein n=1 Tax=Chlorobium phaeovibrioides TaxID=1094 RepID=UPI000F830D79|nr:hypothetical protein [Chlorobium phaeovibrioides]MDT9547030.1 hypothetical protein [Chlorobium phaeovibrioides]RTY36612.1 hypothetical protein EKD00_02405 [Chlorobium phaeovibrioides]